MSNPIFGSGDPNEQARQAREAAMQADLEAVEDEADGAGADPGPAATGGPGEPGEGAGQSVFDEAFGPEPADTEAPAGEGRGTAEGAENGQTVPEPERPDDAESAIPTTDLGTLFHDARVMLLPDLNGPTDRHGNPASVAPHRVVELREPVRVAGADGTVHTFDPRGERGVSASYLVRSPNGSIRAANTEDLNQGQQQAEQITEQGGEQAAGGQKVSWLGALMTAMVASKSQRDGLSMRETMERDLNEREQASYRQWLEMQAMDAAQASRRHHDAAQRAYDEITSDQRVQSEMKAISALKEKASRGAATPQDFQDMEAHRRNISRAVQEDPNLAAKYQDMQEHVDRMIESHDEVMTHAEENGLTDKVRDAMPGDTALNRMNKRIGNLSRDGESSEEERKRMERLKEMAERITEALKRLVKKKMDQDQEQGVNHPT